MGFEGSTSINNFPEETTIRSLRSFDEYSTLQPIEFSTEETINKKRNHHHLSITSSTDKHEDENSMIMTTEISSPNKRENQDFSFTTIESTTEMDQSSSIEETEKQTESNASSIQSELTTEIMVQNSLYRNIRSYFWIF